MVCCNCTRPVTPQCGQVPGTSSVIGVSGIRGLGSPKTSPNDVFVWVLCLFGWAFDWYRWSHGADTAGAADAAGRPHRMDTAASHRPIYVYWPRQIRRPTEWDGVYARVGVPKHSHLEPDLWLPSVNATVTGFVRIRRMNHQHSRVRCGFNALQTEIGTVGTPLKHVDFGTAIRGAA